MGKNIIPAYPLRVDPELLKKIDIIAEKNSRNRRQQIECSIKNCIKEYEEKYGEINTKTY